MQYVAENGSTRASCHFIKELGKNVPESTARRLKKEYINKLKLLMDSGVCDGNPQVTVLPKQVTRKANASQTAAGQIRSIFLSH